MKRPTKALSVLLAFVMMFSMAMPAFAAVKDGTTSVAGLVSTDSICALLDWLLKNLNERKDKFVPTVLTFVDRYVDDIAAYIPNGRTVDTMADEEKAACLIKYCDALLAENLGDTVPENITNLASTLRITIDLKSVNGIMKTLKSVDGLVSADMLGILYGDINDINFKSLQKNGNAIQTSDGYLYVVKQLFQFLKDNSNIFQKVIKGNLDLGSIIEEFFNPDVDAAIFKQPDGSDVPGGLNGSMRYLPTYIKNMVYDALIDEPEMQAVAKRDWSIDELLGYAFLNLITGKTNMTKAESSAVMTSTAYANLLKYAPVLYAKFAVEPLNTSFKNVLTDLGNKSAAFKAILNTNYTFAESDFASLGLTAQTGVLGGFNNMVYVVLQKIMTPTAFKELAIEKGTTAAKLNSNLTKLFRYILPKMGTFTGFDFSKFTVNAVKNMSLESMAVQVLKLFYPGWFHTDNSENAFIDSIDTMPEMLVAAAYLGFPTDYYGSRAGYKKIIMNTAGNAVNANLTQEQCIETALNILIDKAVYELDFGKENTLFTLSVADVKKYKDDGWNWEDFADEIVDWALNLIKGVPAVADKLSIVRGKYDGYGAFNKLNAVVNEIIDFSFMSNVSSLTPDGKVMSKIDFETFLIDGVIGNLCDFDIAGILGLFAVNSKPGNILNANFTATVIGIVDKALEAVFNHTCSAASYTINATCVTAGCKINYCANNGHITNKTTIAATGKHTKDSGTVTKAATCTKNGLMVYNCTVCGKLMDTKVINALGHDYRSNGAAYIDQSGNTVQNKKCSRCNDTKVDIIKLASKTPTTITSTTAKIAGSTVEGFFAGITAAELSNAFNEKAYIVIKDAKGNTLAPTAAVKTGDVVSLVVNNKEIKKLVISVLGDIDGDGTVSAADARLALRQSVRLEALNGVYLLAADTDGKDSITASDARAILRQAVKLENFSRVF